MSSFELDATPLSGTPHRFVSSPLAEGLHGLRGGSRAVRTEDAAAHVAEAARSALDLEAVRAEAFAAGRAAERAECPWQEAETLRSATLALEEALRGVGALRRGYLVDQRTALVELACALAERVLGAAVAASSDSIASVVERALANLGEAEGIRLRLSSRDVEAIRAGLAPELARIVEAHGVELEVDPTLAAGDARVLAGRTRVDARLAETLRRLREEMLELVDLQEDAG